ncbi:MAG TPA: M1 family metallopeptidase [Chitinophagaceae bacterium]|nr:M1 family metallopeptidase [Chitinophagaceae bacterium]
MKKIFFLLTLLFPFLLKAQVEEQPKDTSWKKIHRVTTPKINDLVHTKLDVKFDYDKAWMYGKAWITLRPHFYPTDSLSLDAKGMAIKEISIVRGTSKSPLQYKYDGMILRISLDKMYKGGENYTVYIDYTSKPNELKAQGSAAITDAKGLYFINPKGDEKDKPTQIWTQGETEANSAWFPTIDKPNQKTTEEIYMTVPAKYVTLSNGLLISQKNNADGTRTDYWKMDLLHAPYLFFMGVGDYTIVKDSYKGKEVSYYVEKEYAPYARKIFGNTPEMIKYYSSITGVDYPWAKYSQIVGRDYVSGAMENTTATLHQESAYQNARELTDGNRWEEVIAHELFHQWFGDYVTAESWSNLTVNESFATMGSQLWNEYKYGKDAADEERYNSTQGYINSGSEDKDLVRFNYNDKEDVFDAVSYNKGGAILQMLRNMVGDDAFYKSLNNYLVTNKFKTGEAQQLRLAFEEVTGKDLNPFFNQWYYGSGHPKLDISYNYNENKKQAQVFVKQTQATNNLFQFPVAIDVYSGSKKTRHNVWIKNAADTFAFASPTKPDLINFDGDKILIAQKTENKNLDNYVHQYKYAPNYVDRREALEYFSKKKAKELAEGLNDRYEGLRQFTLEKFNTNKTLLTTDVVNRIEQIANNDRDKKVKAKAIEILAKQNDKKYIPLFTKFVSDSSYSVAGAALEGLSKLDPANAYTLAKKYSGDAKGKLGNVISASIMSGGTEADFDFVLNQYKTAPPSQEKIQLTSEFADYLTKIKDGSKVRKGVDEMMKFRNLIPEQFRNFTDPSFKSSFDKLSKAQRDAGNKEVADYVSGLIK